MKIKRINKGIYAITLTTKNGCAKHFEAEDFSIENGGKPDWQLFEITSNGNREWWNDFAKLSDIKWVLSNI
jgi:hypothetical protein